MRLILILLKAKPLGLSEFLKRKNVLICYFRGVVLVLNLVSAMVRNGVFKNSIKLSSNYQYFDNYAIYYIIAY